MAIPHLQTDGPVDQTATASLRLEDLAMRPTIPRGAGENSGARLPP